MRRLLRISLIAIVHFVISVAAFVKSVSIGMSEFDGRGALTFAERLFITASEVLVFPISLVIDILPRGWFPSLWGHVLVGMNSILWATCIYFAWFFIIRRRTIKQDT